MSIQITHFEICEGVTCMCEHSTHTMSQGAKIEIE